MPRIPTANFNRLPSDRVGNIQTPNIQGATSDKLRKLGKTFVGIGNKISKAQEVADRYGKNTKISAERDKELDAEIKALLNGSVNGKVSDPNDSTKKVNLSDAVSTRVKSFNEKALQEIGKDPIALALYSDTSSSILDKYVATAERQQVKEISSGLNRTIKQNTNALVMKARQGSLTDKDLVSFDFNADQMGEVLGANNAQKSKEALRILLSGSASSLIQSMGADPQNIAKAKKLVAMAPPNMKEALKVNLESTIKTKNIAMNNLMYANAGELLNSVKSDPLAVARSTDSFRTSIASISRTKLAEGEPLVKRGRMLSKMASKLISSQALSIDPFMSVADFSKNSADSIDNIYRSLASTPIGIEYAKQDKASGKKGANALKDLIRQQVMADYVDFQRVAKDDVAGMQFKMNPDLASAIESGSPEKRADLVSSIGKASARLGLRSSSAVIISKDQADAGGAQFLSFESGGDPDGGKGQKLIADIQAGKGELTQKYLADVFSVAKQRKQLPAMVLIASQAKNSSFVGNMFQNLSSYKKNLSIISSNAINKTGDSFTPATFKALISNSLPSSVRKLAASTGTENSNIRIGYEDGIAQKAASLMANQNLSKREAVNRAVEFMNAELPIIDNPQGGSVIVDTSKLRESGLVKEDVSVAMQSLNTAEGFSGIVDKIDFTTLNSLLAKAPSLHQKFNTLSKKTNSLQSKTIKAQAFLDQFKDNIFVVNDPFASNTVSVTLRGLNGEVVQIPMFNESGKRVSTKIDLIKLARQVKNSDLARQIKEDQQTIDLIPNGGFD